jgi:hypothetical protein
MHYVTSVFHWREKYKFSVTCPSALFVKSIPVLPKHEKQCVTVALPGWAGMLYVTRISHRMQKHNLGVTCPGTFFVESVLVPPEHEK